MHQQSLFLEIGSMRLKTLIIGELDSNKTCIVLLHGGLDSLETWKGYPEALAKKTGLTVIAYERFGHGESGCLSEVRKAGYRHLEANETLPAVVNKLGLNSIILVGHSDGAAMCLLAAETQQLNIIGVCAIAPPLVPEEMVRTGIVEAIKEYEDGNLAKKLKLFHGDATDSLFYGWAKAWLSPEFDDWSCEEEIQAIRCPVHAIFGQADDYGYRASMSVITNNLSAPMEVLVLKGIGHMPHHHARQETIDSINRLIKRTAANE
ncbi:MAG TPA: alpha/beta hydrolase [Cycloclasticus sp.]|jgi:pimeloyl-ACP methyl ester carboxylesterase|nr:alpha/beta hydrolase [Cycloclasticus sp.]HIL92816.1 alpha/beta hydrolase [Cycloclasticus sp.]